MATNYFQSVQEIARQSIMQLYQELVMPNLIYKDYSGDYQAGKGATVLAKLPPEFTAHSFTPSGGTVTEYSIDDNNTVAVTLDTIATVDVGIQAIEMATDIDDLKRQFTDPAARALADYINNDCMNLYKTVPYWTGTAASTPDALSDFTEPSKIMNDNKVPMSGRQAIWNPAALAKFQLIDSVLEADKSGTTQALREGSIGRLMAIDNYMSQSVKTHTTGAATSGTIAIDLSAGYSAGDTTIHVDGLSAAFIVGDRFTLGGYQYVVTAASALATADQDITIYPPLVADAADGAALTVIASHAANMVFHENAFAFVTRPLIAPSDKLSYTVSYNGLSLRVVRGYDMSTKKEKLSMDVLYGYKALKPEAACLVLG